MSPLLEQAAGPVSSPYATNTSLPKSTESLLPPAPGSQICTSFSVGQTSQSSITSSITSRKLFFGSSKSAQNGSSTTQISPTTQIASSTTRIASPASQSVPSATGAPQGTTVTPRPVTDITSKPHVRLPLGAVAGITLILILTAACCLCIYRSKRYRKAKRSSGEREGADMTLVTPGSSASLTTPRPFVLDPAASGAHTGVGHSASVQLDRKWVIRLGKCHNAVDSGAPRRNSTALSTQSEIVRQSSCSDHRESSSSVTMASAMRHPNLTGSWSSITSSITDLTVGEDESIAGISSPPPTYRSRISSQISMWSRHVSIVESTFKTES